MSKSTPNKLILSRRSFLAGSGAGLALMASGVPIAPAIAQANRPVITHGIQAGDVTQSSAVVWSRADRPSRMMVEVAATEAFKDAHVIRGPAALSNSDFTAKIALQDLPPGEDVFYRVTFQDLDNDKAASEPAVGRLRTAPAERRDVNFVWSGDTAGQGWGINEAWGGMKGFEGMRSAVPDFFIHCGDCVYADGPIEAEAALPDGSIWKNVTIEEKSKVAETLKEFRGNYKYNLLDANYRRFMAEVPMYAQWDDHETLNNWYPNEILDDDRYKVKSVALLSARANQAFREYMPINEFQREPGRVYRKFSYGPMLDIFMLDMRSYRGDNGPNRQEVRGRDTDFLGPQQIAWLKRELLSSKATWKLIAADMPIGLIVYDNWKDKSTFENGANGDGPVLGREFDFAELLSFMKANNIRNTVWVTADVHYTAAHYYDPSKAVFQDFLPFWEFVSGPINAGTFGPGDMDNTFGPQVMFSKDPGGTPNLPPTMGLQFFGQIGVDAASGIMTVDLKDIENKSLYQMDMIPEA